MFTLYPAMGLLSKVMPLRAVTSSNEVPETF